MSEELQFSLSFRRQYSGPLDVDLVFPTTLEKDSYLSSPRRYAGQVVSCLEEEGKVFVLNGSEDAWIEVSGSSGDISQLQSDVVDLSAREEFIKEEDTDIIQHVNSGYFSELELVPTLSPCITAGGIGPSFELSAWLGIDKDYLSNKALSKCRFVNVSTTNEGEVALNDDGKLILRRNGSDELILSNIEMKFEYDDGCGPDLEWYDINPFEISIFNGDSDLLGLNGVPLIVGMTRGIGAYPTVPKIMGGSY